MDNYSYSTHRETSQITENHKNTKKTKANSLFAGNDRCRAEKRINKEKGKVTRSEQGDHEFEMQEGNPEQKIQALTREISDITGQLTAEIQKRRQSEKTLAKHLEFDRLLSDFSAGFVNIPLDQADKEIERALKRINEFFEGDLCALLEVLPDKTVWKVTHVAVTGDIPTVPVGTEFQSSICPWSFKKVIQKRELFSFSRLDDLPLEASVDKQTFLEWGIRSMLEMPIILGDSIDRVIVVNSLSKECVWAEEIAPKLQILGEIFVNALERKRNRLKIEEQLRFERLISNLSSDFVNLLPDQVDSAINTWLRSITEFLHLDRCSIGLFSNDTIRLVFTFEYYTAQTETAPESIMKEQVPWYMEQLMAGKPVIMSRVADLPPEAERERRLCLVRGIKSLLSVPLRIGDNILGFCSFVSTREERIWSEELIPRLRLAGEIFANVLKRKQSELELRESEERLSLATESAKMGLWVMNVDTGLLWATEKMRELFQFLPEEVLSLERLVEVIHPDDREMVREHIDQSVEEQQFFRVEYRIGKPDGDIRWIVTRGRPYCDAKGSPLHLMGVSTDITERKLVELQLKRSQTLLDTVINSTPDMIWSVDSERFGLTTFNRGLYEYFLHGIGLHIQTGMNPDDLLPTKEYAQKWHAFYRRALEEGSFTTEYQVCTGNRTLRLNFNILKRDDVVFGVSVFGQDITEFKGMENQLRQQLEEIETLKLQTEKENVYLREEIRTKLGFGNIIGDSDALRYVLFRSQQVAPTDATVLILGETGTGKGMVAYAIHEMSPRKDKSMVTVNRAALPENLIESELFGRERGAFTGAHARQIGRSRLLTAELSFWMKSVRCLLHSRQSSCGYCRMGSLKGLAAPGPLRWMCG